MRLLLNNINSTRFEAKTCRIGWKIVEGYVRMTVRFFVVMLKETTFRKVTRVKVFHVTVTDIRLLQRGERAMTRWDRITGSLLDQETLERDRSTRRLEGVKNSQTMLHDDGGSDCCQ